MNYKFSVSGTYSKTMRIMYVREKSQECWISYYWVPDDLMWLIG